MTVKSDPLLSLTYIPEDEWHGELRVEASHAGFSGRAAAWFNREDIRKFAAHLRALANDDVRKAELKGGYFSDSTTSAAPIETHVGIHVARHPVKFIASVELADPGDAVRPQSVRLQMEIAWAALYHAADAIEAMLAEGGTAAFKVVQNHSGDPEIVKARHPIQRPYTPLFLALRERFRGLIKTMELESPFRLPPKDRQLGAQDWEAYTPGLIMAQIDWDNARLQCSGGVDDDGRVITHQWSQFDCDLKELKVEALQSAHPRAHFDSYAAFILQDAQDSLVEFFRDGPTDDIPFNRHQIFVGGLNGGPAQIWVSNIQFTFCDVPA